MYQLLLQKNLSEVISYQNPSFMLRAYQGDLNEYVNHAVPAHWHSEIEWILLLSGTAAYHVNATRYDMQAGDALLVNSNRLHFGYSPEHTNFVYAIIQFHPDFVENRCIRQDYLNRLIGDSSLDGALIRPDTEAHRAMLADLAGLIRLNLDDPEEHRLDTMELFYRLLLAMSRTGLIPAAGQSEDRSTQITALQNMLTYIQDHYAEPIRLADIAAAGTMCRSKCCNLFRDVLQQSPMEFTQYFRIQKSIALLRETDLSISEIAAACGFSNASYFVEVFHRTVSRPPRQYRSELQARK